MKNEIAVREMVELLKQEQGEGLQINEEEIVKEHTRKNANKSTLTIKIVSIVGGQFACGQFISFLYLFGLMKSGGALMGIGIALIVASLFASRILQKLVFDTIAIFALSTGFFLLALGMYESKFSENEICCWLVVASAAGLLISKNAMLIFISLMTFSQSILALILLNRFHELIHLFITVNVIVLAYWMLNEGAIITWGKRFCELYDPVRIGLIFSLVSAFAFTTVQSVHDTADRFAWIPSVAMIPILLYVVKCILDVINVTLPKEKAIAYVIASLILAATFFAPCISGALVIILLCFLVNYRTGFVIVVPALIYFVCHYYYDLNLTLLTKSILMLVPGVLFIFFYLLTNKKLQHNEEI